MARLDDPPPAESPEPQADPDAQQHHDQGGRDVRPLQEPPPVPDDEHRDRHETDHGRAGLDIPEQPAEFGERVRVVRLQERHVSFRVGVVAQDVRDLFQDQDHADRGHQALDHAGREEGREGAGPRQAQGDLDQARDHHGEQERLERAQRGDLGRHDRRQAGGGAADARLRPAQGPHQHAADDPGHAPPRATGRWTPAPPRGTRERDEGHDQAGREITRQGRGG